MQTPALEAMLGVVLGACLSKLWFVGLLGIERSALVADAMQLEAQRSLGRQSKGFDLLLREIPAQIPMEFPVGRVPGVAISRGPDRQGGIAVAPEKGHTIAAANRGIHPISGAWFGVEQTMAIQHRVAQAGIAHPYIKAFVVGAFR